MLSIPKIDLAYFVTTIRTESPLSECHRISPFRKKDKLCSDDLTVKCSISYNNNYT